MISIPSSVPVASSWQPILDGDCRRRAVEVLHHISRTLDTAIVEEPDLGNGAPGVALFLTYRSIYDASSGGDAGASRDRAAFLLCSAATAAASTAHPSSFLQGLTGVAWTIDHLRLHHGLEIGCEPQATVDRMLLEHLSEKPWRGVYELGHGLVGYGLYAAEDIDAPGRRQLFEKVVDQLAATALPSNHGGVTWWTAPQNLGEAQRKEAPMGHFNIGLAHGVPSVIAILGLAYVLHVADETARKLAAKALAWVRAQRQPEGSGSCFGTTIPLGARPSSRPSRVGWCFGDLGISASLYWAACNLDDATTAVEMLDIARLTARRAPGTCQVKDAGICHGAAGNAHIFNRFYQATREEMFLDASLYWFERMLEYYDSRAAASPQSVSTTEPESPSGPADRNASDIAGDGEDAHRSPGWSDRPGFFGGLAGIGLTLLAAMIPAEPAWDRMLLVSMPLALS